MTSPSKLTVSEIQRVLQGHQDDLQRLGVSSLSVFGSVGRGEATAASDIDFLVVFIGSATLSRYMELKLLLESQALRPRLQSVVEKEAVRVA